MIRSALCLAALLALLPPASSQTILMPILDATHPGSPDNHREFFVVQPSRHGEVFVLPLITGNTGYMAVPIWSLQADYGMDNLSPTSLFCSLDVEQHLVFPNPIYNATLNWLPLVGPLALGVLTPQVPVSMGAPASTPWNREIAMYLQVAAVLPLSTNPWVFDMDFSNGLSVIQTEGIGQPLGGAPIAVSAKRGAALAAGDLNGDGVDDLAVGAPGDLGGGHVGAGRVYLYVGLARTASSLGGLHPVPYILEEPDLTSLLPGENPGPEAQAHFGASLSIGDLDGDGIAELAVAAPEGDGVAGEPDQGEVYVFRALESLLSPVPLAAPQILSVPATTVVQARPVIERAFARYGYDLLAQDFDGDGVDDLVASAPFLDVSLIAEQEVGAVYCFRGPFLPGVGFRNEDLLIQDDVLGDYEHFGAALAHGDLDGDQIEELLVGVPGQQVSGSQSAGKVAALHVTPSGTTTVLTLEHPLPVASAGLGLSLAAGDLNGDGLDDLVAASDEAVGGAPNAGRVHLFRLGPGFATSYEAFSTVAPQDFERFGRRLLVTDLNDDGLEDVAVGAPGCPANGQPFTGRVFVYFGTQAAVLDDTFRTLHLDSDDPHSFALYGTAVAAGDFAGVGVPDLVVGAPLAADGNLTAAGRVVVHTDLLHRKDNLTVLQFLGGVAPNP